MSDAPETRPPRGLARDFQRAGAGTKASAAELREFVRQFRGKKPQEMLGLVAGSTLVQATIMATVLTLVGMAVGTVVPYLWKKSLPPPVAKAGPSKPAAAPAPTAAAATSAAPTAAGTAPAPAPTAAVNTVPRDPVLERLGIGETKIADPKKNPLDAGSDDLLKDIK